MDIVPETHQDESPAQSLALTPLAEACYRLDLTAIHEMLEKAGYKDDEGVANEVRKLMLFLFILLPGIHSPSVEGIILSKNTPF